MSSSSQALSSARRRRAAPEGIPNQSNSQQQQVQQQQRAKQPVSMQQLLQQHDIRLFKLENEIPDVINEIQQNMALLLEERDSRQQNNNIINDNNTINDVNSSNKFPEYNAKLFDIPEQVEVKESSNLSIEEKNEFTSKINELEGNVKRIQNLLNETNTTLLTLVNKEIKKEETINNEHVVSEENMDNFLNKNNNVDLFELLKSSSVFNDLNKNMMSDLHENLTGNYETLDEENDEENDEELIDNRKIKINMKDLMSDETNDISLDQTTNILDLDLEKEILNKQTTKNIQEALNKLHEKNVEADMLNMLVEDKELNEHEGDEEEDEEGNEEGNEELNTELNEDEY